MTGNTPYQCVTYRFKVDRLCTPGTLLSPHNSVGWDIVTRPIVGRWMSEWVRAWVDGSVTFYLVDTKATTVFAQSLSNLICKLWMMRGGTLLILGHGSKVKSDTVYKSLLT